MPETRSTVVAPGRRYPMAGALLMYAAEAAQRRGSSLHEVVWQIPETGGPPGRWVNQQVTDVLDTVSDTDSVMVIGKSLGSIATQVVAERGLPAVWFTPLLQLDDVVEGLRAATRPVLLIGGTADEAWKTSIAHELTPYVCEISGADHGMLVHGRPLSRSIDALNTTTSAVENFLDDIVWPG